MRIRAPCAAVRESVPDGGPHSRGAVRSRRGRRPCVYPLRGWRGACTVWPAPLPASSRKKPLTLAMLSRLRTVEVMILHAN